MTQSSRYIRNLAQEYGEKYHDATEEDSNFVGEGYDPDTFESYDEFPICHVCGDPSDYCPGHGSY